MDTTDPAARAAKDAFGIEYLFPWQRLVIANILDAVNAVTASGPAKVRPCGPDSEPDGSAPSQNGDALHDEDGALRGRQIVLLPTGAGKSLCFQVPALLLPGPTLVIYPILALMSDQERSMKENGIEPAVFRGGQTSDERERQLARLEGTDGKPAASDHHRDPEVSRIRGYRNTENGRRRLPGA